MSKFILFLFFIIQTSLWSQKYKLSGVVVDEKGNPIEGAEIVLNQNQYYTVTRTSGVFNFNNLPKGTYHLDAFFVGYETYHFDVVLTSDQKDVQITMKVSVESLNEVEIHAKSTVVNQREASLHTEVANAKYIQNNLKVSLMKSLEDLPGVSTIDVGSGQSKPVIRGLSFNQVAVVENGIKHEGQQWGEDHGLEIDPYAVKQVEIIKGPASLLYGSDAIGGIILINNASYPYEEGMKAKLDLNTKTFNASYGGSFNITTRKNAFYTDNRISFNDYADYKVPVDSVEVYSYKVGLDNRRLRNTAGSDLGLHHQSGVINDRHHTRLYLSYYYSKNAFFANAHGLEPRYVDLDLHDASNRDVQEPHQTARHFKAVFNSTLIRESGNWDFELGYQKNYRKEFSPYVNHGYMPPIFPEDLGFSSHLERFYDKDIISANLKKEYKKGLFVHKFGLSSEWQKNKISGWSFIIPAFQKSAIGVFAYSQYKVKSDFFINGGLRYDFGTLHTEAYHDWFQSEDSDGSLAYLQRAAAIEKQYQSLSWALGLSRNSEHFELKLNMGKSFRMPIAKEITSNGVNYHHFSYETGNIELKPEVSYQLDMGMEWHYKDWALQISPFVNYFPNYIYLNPTSDYDFLYGAGNQIYRYTDAEVFRFGGELHAHYNISNRWKSDIIAEYVYSEQITGAKKGYGLPFAPPGNIITKLTFKLPDYSAWSDANITLSQKYTLAQNQIVPPEKKTQASSVWDLSYQSDFKVKNQFWYMTLQLNNIFNLKYFNHTNYYRVIGIPEAGRNLTLTLRIPLI